MRPIVKTMIWLTLFSIAMGYLETSVVVYLRKLYYPGGFKFPLVPVTREVATVEFWREAATIIMLLGIGILAGKNPAQRFVFFLYSFAVWDLFYYVFLKVALNWPESLFTWDILFLIPIPWVGPVITPCIVCLSMIFFTGIVIYHQEKGKHVHLSFMEWMLFTAGSIVTILSFCWDYIVYVSKHPAKLSWTLGSREALFDEVKDYIPQEFNWSLFFAGQFIVWLAIFFVYKRIRK
ncbi:MAG: hypothetical protein ACJ77K_03955 [Bacteroidia bacterium]